MRIPILVSGTPSSLTDGTTCRVYLHHGQWRMVCENLVDSTFSIVVGKRSVLHKEDIITGPCDLVIVFSEKGSEKNLNIYAEDNA